MEDTAESLSPSRNRSFKIGSKKPHYGSSKAEMGGADRENIPMFGSVVEVSRSKIGSLGPKKTSGGIIRPGYSAHPTTYINTDSITPPRPRMSPRKNPLIENTISGIQQKLFRPSGSQAVNKSTLSEICSLLAQIPTGGISNLDTQSENFQQSSIKLKIKSLGNKKFRIFLPSTEGNPGLPVANNGEQGEGGTCDRFIGMLPESCWDISQKASPLGLVPKLLPRGKVGESVRYIASCFWIWLCVVDDLTENLVGRHWEEAESDLMQVFANNASEGCYYNAESDAIKVSLALRLVIDTTDIKDNNSRIVDNSWRDVFRGTVREVLTGFQAERPLLGTRKIALSDWMRVRMVTISARPFMILARASLGLDLVLSALGNPLIGDYISLGLGRDTNLAKVERLLQLIMGLQNDILGWEKDLKANNSLNAIQILTQNGMKPRTAMKTVIGAHNELVQHLSNYGERAWVESLSAGHSVITGSSTSPQKSHWSNIFGIYYRRNSTISLGPDLQKGTFMPQQRHSVPDDNARQYLELIIGFANGMANWMLVSKRYVA